MQTGDGQTGQALKLIGKWFGLLALLAVLVAGDQIRINRPGHKYRLTVEVETPDGIKTGAGVMAVVPDRGYSPGGRVRTRGDAIFLDLGRGKNLVVLMAHLDGKWLDLDDINFVALRAYGAARGSRVPFKELSQLGGVVPVQGAVIPVLVTFGNPSDPATARTVAADNAQAVLGDGFRLHGMTVEIVPNGFWPLDFGGPLGEPVTRGIAAKLPWLTQPGDPAAVALKAAGLTSREPIAARDAFTRK